MEEFAQAPVGGGYHFTLPDFEGPLDVLLLLIRKNDRTIFDFPIAEIT